MDYVPDWSPSTIDRIDKVLSKNYTVYEWGTGYSTIWLAQRAGKVITMEHNPDWYRKIKLIAESMGITNIEFNLYPLEDERYFTHVKTAGNLDLIIVDGRERMKCFKEAKDVFCNFIMLDDSERERYAEAFGYGFKFIDTLVDYRGQKATIFYTKEKV